MLSEEIALRITIIIIDSTLIRTMLEKNFKELYILPSKTLFLVDFFSTHPFLKK